MAATDRTENIALSRNEVVRTPSGERTWRGTFWNHSDSLRTRGRLHLSDAQFV
jgi:hypothetical protein